MAPSSLFTGKPLGPCPPVRAQKSASLRSRAAPVTARLETPQKPGHEHEEAKQGDAFKELVELSKKQSVNRPRDVGCLSKMRSRAWLGMHIWHFAIFRDRGRSERAVPEKAQACWNSSAAMYASQLQAIRLAWPLANSLP